MGVVKLSKSEITDYEKYSSMLAGNAAYIPNSFDLLETTTLGTAASSVTFSGLGSYSDYKHLQLRIVTTAAAGASNGNLYVRPNGVTTNQNTHFLRGRNGSVASGYTSGQWQFEYFPENTPYALVIDILDFSNTSKNKTMRALSGHTDTSITPIIYLTSGLWNTTTAITSLTIANQSGNMIIGSRFSLYGIK